MHIFENYEVKTNASMNSPMYSLYFISILYVYIYWLGLSNVILNNVSSFSNFLPN